MRSTLRHTRWGVFLIAGLTACSSESRDDPRFEPELDEPGTLRGYLSAQIADFDDGTAETRYFLRDAEGVDHRLVVRGSVDLAPGSKIKVWGTRRADDSIDVGSYQRVHEMAGHEIESQSQPLIDGGTARSRFLCTGIVALNGGTPKVSTSAALSAFYVGLSSVNAFFLENSYGKVGLDGFSYGPFPYSMTGCDTTGLATAIRPMIDASAPVKCDQYAFIFGPQQVECGWSALAQMGTRAAPATDTWFNDATGCVTGVQEPSHNYGQLHSSSMTCSGVPFADDPSSCTHSEYGDRYDAMGGGCYHMNGWQKLFQGWFGGCNGVSTSSSGTFYLQAIETPCDGVQVLRVPFPGGKTRSFQNTTLTSYYVELRTSYGFDSKLAAPQVLLHVGGDPPLPNQVNPLGLHTWLLAMTVSPTSPGLPVGQSFTDPAGGLTIGVQAVDQRATINVEYASGTGAPYCLDGLGTTFVPPGPEGCAPDGGPVGTGGTGGSGGVGGSSGAGGEFGGVGVGGWGTGGGGTGGGGGSGGSVTGGTGGTTVGSGGTGTGGTTVGSGGTGTGGTTVGSGGVGTGGTSGGTGGSAGEGGTATGGDAGRAGSDGDPIGGSAGASGSGATGGTAGSSGAAGAATSGSGGLDRDASNAGTVGTVDDSDDRRRRSCVCTLAERGASSSEGSALVALGAVAVLRRRRRRVM